jgi:hypothetical protein
MAAFAILVASCSPSASPQSASPTASHTVAATLKVTLVPLSSTDPSITVKANYIVVSGEPNLDAVNGALKQMVVDDIAHEKTGMPSRPDLGTPAVTITADLKLIEANPAFVSALVPAEAGYPDGGVGEYWLATTVTVPAGAPVKIDALFADPAKAPDTLTQLVKAQARQGTNTCAASAVDDPSELSDPWTHLDTYSAFAVLPTGLAIGIAKYQLLEGACGSWSVVIPWTQLDSYLSTEGKQLRAALV